jgi:hypothetical protein
MIAPGLIAGCAAAVWAAKGSSRARADVGGFIFGGFKGQGLAHGGMLRPDPNPGNPNLIQDRAFEW